MTYGYGRHGHHRRHHGWDEGPWGPGPWYGSCRGHGLGRFPRREEMLKRLEEYQKDLEQRTADVADMIRRLKEKEAQQETTSV